MIMGDIATYLAIALGFALGMPALSMFSAAMWPESLARRVAVASKGVGKSLLFGLIPVAVATLVIAVFAKRLGPVPALLISGSLIVWGLMGSAAFASLVGSRLWPTAEAWKQMKNGSLVVICCAAIPFVGWFLLLPLIAIIGMGVNVRCLMEGRPAAAAQPVAATAQPEAQPPVAV